MGFNGIPQSNENEVRGEKSGIEGIKAAIPVTAIAGEKVASLGRKLEELDNKGQLHGISARQLTESLKEVLRGDKTIESLEESNFTLGEDTNLLNLKDIARSILLDIVDVSTQIDKLKKIAFSFDLGENFMSTLSKIESGIYVSPATEGNAYERVKILERANEIMGLKKPNENHTQPWTDLKNPPEGYNPESKF